MGDIGYDEALVGWYGALYRQRFWRSRLGVSVDIQLGKSSMPEVERQYTQDIPVARRYGFVLDVRVFRWTDSKEERLVLDETSYSQVYINVPVRRGHVVAARAGYTSTRYPIAPEHLHTTDGYDFYEEQISAPDGALTDLSLVGTLVAERQRNAASIGASYTRSQFIAVSHVSDDLDKREKSEDGRTQRTDDFWVRYTVDVLRFFGPAWSDLVLDRATLPSTFTPQTTEKRLGVRLGAELRFNALFVRSECGILPDSEGGWNVAGSAGLGFSFF